jgi:hypothetical protein
MDTKNECNQFPEFLRSFENLTAHFDEHFGSLGSNERGDSFLNLSEKLIPLIEDFSNFPPPTPSEKKTHDGGVDLLTTENLDGHKLCVQSKYKIRDKAEFDSIISKFRDFENKLKPLPKQGDLFEKDYNQEIIIPIPEYAITTSSKLEGILNRYIHSTLASKSYYDTLLSEKRLIIIDGPKILKLLQQLYRKSNLIPSNIEIRSTKGWLDIGDVYIGVVSGQDLKGLYSLHGDALFFENIRDFLGVTSGRIVKTRSTVNQEIINTISNEPRRMLSRNNGIVFRAVSASPNGQNKLNLEKAAIVNGCQTTMSLVHSLAGPNECQVLVKVVVTEDAWDIAKAANYQNEVARIDLDLARFLRPQLVRRIATSLGYAIESNSASNASAVLNAIYQYKIDYDELKLFYLGIFSRKPNNIFDANYTELRVDVLESLYDMADNEEKIFSVILILLKESRNALTACEKIFSGEEYSHLFKRFYKDDKPRYRSFLAVAAACATVRQDISSREASTEDETSRMSHFLADCRRILENDPKDYHRSYKNAFATVADTLLDVDCSKGDEIIYQNMFNKMSNMSFSSVYKRILIRIDADRDSR